jgi:hypothetical protein
MSVCRKALLVIACAPMLLWGACASAQQPTEHKGLSVIKAKCFQCHTDSMWRDQRQSSRDWEATLYRMVGRGGLWTTEEIKLMADYLGTDFGPNVKPNEPAR